MDYKVELVNLVKNAKANAKASGGKLTNDEIAEKLRIGRTYLSNLLSENGPPVDETYVILFKSQFRNELAGAVKPSKPKDPLNVERAYIKTLVQRFAALESRLTGREKTDILAEIERDTIANLRELEQE